MNQQPPQAHGAAPMRALADFGALCGVGATLAAESGHPVLVSWTTEVPRCTVAEQVRRLSTGPARTFVWTSTWTGHRRLAVGTALDVTGCGADRFEQVSASWRRARDGALVGGTGRRPSLVGGFSFVDGGADSWPAALMWLPAAELTEVPGSPTELTLNAWLRPSEQRDAAVQCAGAPCAVCWPSRQSLRRNRPRSCPGDRTDQPSHRW